MSELRYDGKVAIVTGSGNGLGRSHAMLLASRGAKVVINDLGGDTFGKDSGGSMRAADAVVKEIQDAGGEAVANYDSVTDGDKIVQTAMDTWGKIDILINNAGILRDIAFHNMSDDDWDAIYNVHLKGTFKVTHAAWPHMRNSEYGRIITTASSAGIYGNFGQANYSAVKLAVFGFAQTLAQEGAKRNIKVNTIAPFAGSRMTETILDKEMVEALNPQYVSPLVSYLCHDECPVSGALFEVGGGWHTRLRWQRTKGVTLPLRGGISLEQVRDNWEKINDFSEHDFPVDTMGGFAPISENLKTR